jgi:hypothetical protein
MNAPIKHRVSFEVHGRSAAEVDGKARAVLSAYAGGDLDGWRWSVDAGTSLATAEGDTVGWTATVSAVRKGEEEDGLVQDDW